MKGIIIYEDYRGKQVVEAIKLGMVNYECMSDTSDGSWINNLSGIREESTQACCNKEDTYDFETGALISLMKMCGSDKVVRACNEAFSYERDLHELRKDNNNLRYIKSCNESTIESLEKTRDLLTEENEKLKSDCDKYFKTVKNLVIEENDLVEENEKLKLDCEKLQHGYNDINILFCGGRQNGKQYTLLVDLFKKLDQKKVDAAYKEAYNTTLPVWQKEVLKQMYEVRKIEASKYTIPHVHEWLYKIPTKREEMWEKIFKLHKESDVIIKVKKEDVTTFLHEIETKFPEITWASGVKIFETKYTIKDIYFELKTHDVIYFRLWKQTKLSYSSDAHIYSYLEPIHIVYLPPMRWDLFKKGRLVVKVDADNYEDFYNKCEEEIGRKPLKACEGTFTVYYEKGTFHRRPYSDTIPFAKKVVDWEDVR